MAKQKLSQFVRELAEGVASLADSGEMTDDLTMETPPVLPEISACRILVHQCHTYNTFGQASSSVLPPRAAHAAVRRSLSFRASLLWNTLPGAVRDVASLAAFKGLLASLSMSVVDDLVDIAFSNLSC